MKRLFLLTIGRIDRPYSRLPKPFSLQRGARSAEQSVLFFVAPVAVAALQIPDKVDVNYVRRFLRKQKIDLAGRKSWCESNDPDFAAKAADIVGLYMAPTKNAVVVSVDEKPSIQALQRAQGYRKLPNGRTLTGPKP
jgi:hypothetical protein